MLDLAAIQAQLCAEREELRLRAQAPVETAKGDEADMAVMSQNKERTLWLANDAREKLAAIEKALARIEQGTYGACANCRSPIPEERLTAVPSTACCVDCQTQLERPRRRA